MERLEGPRVKISHCFDCHCLLFTHARFASPQTATTPTRRFCFSSFSTLHSVEQEALRFVRRKPQQQLITKTTTISTPRQQHNYRAPPLKLFPLILNGLALRFLIHLSASIPPSNLHSPIPTPSSHSFVAQTVGVTATTPLNPPASARRGGTENAAQS